jgi:hypothetical protein
MISIDVFAVEVSCRFISQDYRRFVDQGPCNSNTLTLAARQFIGFVSHPVGQTNLAQGINSNLFPVSLGTPA